MLQDLYNYHLEMYVHKIIHVDMRVKISVALFSYHEGIVNA